MTSITDKSKVSIGLVVSVVGLAFWVGTVAATQNQHAERLSQLEKDRDEDRKSLAAEMRTVADGVSVTRAKVELLLMLEPRDQGKARGR